MDPQHVVRRDDLAELTPVEPWAAVPPPERRWSAEEWALLELGFRSGQMEDKWNTFVEGQTLFLHRSWTGHGIFEVDFAPTPPDGRGSWAIVAIRVLDARGTYRRRSDVEEAHAVVQVVDLVLDLAAQDRGVDRPARAREPLGPAALSMLTGDITVLPVDVIVNAANSSLLGGGGVDGAIHRAAGPELVAACRLLGGCTTGEAKITPGFRLPSRWVVHTVGPVWQGGGAEEAELLASCYRRSLELADEVDASTLAFPAISTGVYGYPVDLATEIAVSTVRSTATRVQAVTFVCFNDAARAAYEAVLA